VNAPAQSEGWPTAPSTPPPFALLAELTYACPLRCPYCSNPLARPKGGELALEDWQWVVEQAAALGVAQIHLSGGEPTLRPDLVDLVAVIAKLGLYTNLATSAYRLDEPLLTRLKEAGLDHIQISLQAADEATSDLIAGTPSYRRKLEAARLVKRLGFPLTFNIVMHRQNLDQIEAILATAESLGADRLELANAQYYGWALSNRAWLLPTRAQLDHAYQVVEAAKQRVGTRMLILHVMPDYFTGEPKACMDGWGRRHLTVTPDGRALPCPVAGDIKVLTFPSVREHPLNWIWYESPAFNAFRGYDWMEEPCRSCSRKTTDFGGCRCQAFLLTGDAAATDPACRLSPKHDIVASAVAAAETAAPPRLSAEAGAFTYRTAPRLSQTAPRQAG
jgi:pyrroloquinoline quinone biosynthesis protein E